MATDRKEYMRKYQREWMAKRRAEYFKDKECVTCGTTERLELDHVDPSTKEHHAIWSWSKERREKELAKCQVLCHDCHLVKSNGERSRPICKRGHVAKRLSNGSCIQCREEVHYKRDLRKNHSKAHNYGEMAE